MRVNDNYSLESLLAKIEINIQGSNNPVQKDRYQAIINEIKSGKLTYAEANTRFLNS